MSEGPAIDDGVLPLEGDDVAAMRPPTIGPIVEFLAVGGLTLFLFPLSWLLRAAVGLDEAELAVGFTMFQLAHVLNDPHFAVSYLLFYERAGARTFGEELPPLQRVRYLFAGLVVPLVLIAWAGWALSVRDAPSLGWMVQLMFLTVGWHYAKQGFGVLTVLSARRGVRFTDVERRALLALAYASWAFAWANPALPAGQYEEKGVVYWAPARPHLLELVAGAALAVIAVIVVALFVRKLRREGALPFTPLVGFGVTLASWTIFTTADRLVQYMIPALHSLQYLFFVWLLRRNRARVEAAASGGTVRARLAWLAVSSLALGWALFRGVPGWLDEVIVPRWGGAEGLGDLGTTPFFATFFVVVSIHHYFMDTVLWRRDMPETRFLAADPPARA